jgi:hydrogenase maturation protein HypF
MAVSYLYKIFGNRFLDMDLPLFKQAEREKIETIIHMIDHKINCPLTSSAGRLFDAVASILGICQVSAFPAQAPMLLESLLDFGKSDTIHSFDAIYTYRKNNTIHVEDIIHGVVLDVLNGVENSVISKKFHNTIISVIFETANQIRLSSGVNKVVLSGGVFQNKYLLEGSEIMLTNNNFEVYSHAAVPSNDGGIALGQIAIVAKRRESGCV